MNNEVNQEIIANAEKGDALLQWVYKFVLNGLPKVSEPLPELIAPYIGRYKTSEIAIEQFILNQKLKCAGTGFLTGLGGIMTMPVTVPADLVSSLYMELRMIAGIAMIRGYDVCDDQVKTLVYLCLIFNAAGDVIKQAGIQTVEKIAVRKLMPKLSQEIIVKINKIVGFRLITKGGTKGIINVGKIIPVLGGVVGAAYNWTEVAVCAKAAKKMFDENK